MVAVRTEELLGRVALVTGGNSGIGKAAAIGLAKMGAEVILVARDMVRGNQALDEIRTVTGARNVRLVLSDLSSMKEVVKLARTLGKQLSRLDILVNNAAIVPARREVSPDGLELQFAVNHLAYFALTENLLPLLKKSPEGQIILVSSGAHRLGKLDFEDLQWETRPYKSFSVYSTTKLMNIMYARELAGRLQEEGSGVRVNAIHPGVIATNIYRAVPFPIRQLMLLLMKKPEKGARNILYLAADPEASRLNGTYLDDGKVVEPAPQLMNQAHEKQLTDVSRSILESLDLD